MVMTAESEIVNTENSDNTGLDCPKLNVFKLAVDSHIEPEFRRVAPGDVAWDSKSAAGKILVIKEGVLRVYHSAAGARERLSHLLGPSHWVGADVIAGVPGKTRVVAATAAVVALVDASQLIKSASSDTTVASEMIRQLARQLVSARDQITESQNMDCTSRVIHALLRLAECGAASPVGTGNVTLHLTQQDVADSVGIARETVNAILQKLSELNLIQKQRGRITIDEPALRKWLDHVDRAANN